MFKLSILLCLLVCYVTVTSSFLKNTHRAKLFELTDNEMAVFRVTIPEEDLQLLKKASQVKGPIHNGQGAEPFKTKDGSMIVEIKGNKNSFKNVTFSLGGSSSRAYGKQGYNIKIRDKKIDLYGRTQLKLRPDARDATHLRSKLACDIHNKLGLPSISANYALLYLNGEYMDPKNDLTVKNSATNCENENEDVSDRTEWTEFLEKLDKANGAEDIEGIFDVDQFLSEMAYEYLTGAWDHYNGLDHNFNLYKSPVDNKWKFILNDFDSDIGQEIISAVTYKEGVNTDYPNYSYQEWLAKHHLTDILISNNSTRFENILKKTVTEAFNPTVLFPRIDELKDFIRPYIKLDKTPDEKGNLPGKINLNVNPQDEYSFAHWEANSEFTSIRNAKSLNYGLKYWILMKYRYMCRSYNIPYDPYYTNENYSFSTDKEVETTVEDYIQSLNPSINNNSATPATTAASATTPTTPATSTGECWAKRFGFDCCPPQYPKRFMRWMTMVNGDMIFPKMNEECWSTVLGYPCCKACHIIDSDSVGNWGYENDQWCGIQPHCN
ncbi:Non-catalytic module family DOC2 [Piromyces sp. E2]|nr:Non-catalytic module family DOC2 [Piromyces sp. E2]|eukprot:OUM57606.1 Non-catalytic module family DOC2 [Piromyces sp. E2]